MTEWKARRFWTEATVEGRDDAFAVRLDGRPVHTPSKIVLAVPTLALAEGIAAEWRAQGEVIDPLSMPLTRAANSAVDKVRPQHDAVAAELAGYGGTDLLCYRAAAPERLVAKQAEAWDPMLDWAAADLGARLAVTSGVMPVQQPANALATLREHVKALSDWHLTALSEFVTLTGSLVLGLSVLHRHRPAAEVWNLSRIDEEWQIAQWGEDEEEAARVAVKRADFLQADRFLHLIEDGSS
ncbi:ATP12 family chaperone protein [Jannaschia sp. LMIT008]|uniref:ATP12 family chaperone protein n=1 Tax=Jannaschia maritima TaxID=3032585 RepID=UPI00281196F5|nr:ATP12 family protein [Jannaschia sp. LMIT008]